MEEEILIIVCDLIRRKVLKTGMTNNAFAKQCGVCEYTIRKVIRGKHDLKLSSLNKIAGGGFGQELWEMLKESSDENKQL